MIGGDKLSDINTLVQYLLATIPGARPVSGGKQIVCRCPICMDSADPSSAHFYIGPLQDTTKPLQYDCKKCNSSGMFTLKTLQMFDIYDTELATLLAEYNNEITSSPVWKMRIQREGVIHRVQNTFISDSLVSEAKLKYINNRLGLSLTYEDIIRDKIVLNLFDLLDNNGITTYTRNISIIDQLNKYFIGFVSYDNGYVNMRRLCSEGKVYKTIDKRYVNYNIYNTMDNSMRFYLIPVSIDLLDPTPIDVWLTEGPFDCLSVKYNVRPGDRSIYISAGGKGYLPVIKFILQQLGLINIRIHLCPDGDVGDYVMYSIADYLYPFGLDIEMHRNLFKGEKDFGVPASNISESVTILNKSNIFVNQ